MIRRLGALLVLVAAGAIGVVTQPFVAPVPSTPPPVEPDRLSAHVHRLSVDLHPRSPRPARASSSAPPPTSKPSSARPAPRSRCSRWRWSGGPSATSSRASGRKAARLLVIGAHDDSHVETPGADDNASGVAGLIELARLLAAAPQRRPIELVAYTLEEPPYFRTPDMGSARHARALRASGRAVRLMLSLEMIGYFSDAPGSQHYPVPGMRALYPDRGNFVALVGRLADFGAMRRTKALMAGATALPVRSINAPPQLEGIDFSDHLNYWAEGMPAIMVTDTAFMRNTAYHEPGDTADRLDYRRMAQVVQAVYAVTQQD